MVAGVWQGVSVALAAMQLQIRMDLHRVAPEFLEHVELKKRAELVNDFAAALAIVVAVVDVKGIIFGDD